jgi:hypothetical protein
MNCPEFRRSLGGLLEGDLEPAAAQAARAHADDCEPCGRDYQSLLLAESLLQRHGRRTLPAPAHLVDSIMDRLEPRRITLWRELGKLAAAAAVVLTVLGAAASLMDLAPPVEAVKHQASRAKDYVIEDLPRVFRSTVGQWGQNP